MNSKRLSSICILGLTAALILSSAGAGSLSLVHAQSGPPHIIASFSILADIAANVAGNAALVDTLIPLGSNPHAYDPSAQDVVALSEADAVLIVGANFEEGLLSVLEEAGQDRISVMSECVPIRPVVSRALTDHAGEPVPDYDPNADEACQDHYAAIGAAFDLAPASLVEGTLGPLHMLNCDEHSHSEDADHAGEETEAVSCDPHIWTDPINAGLWTLAIRDTLIELDPDNASTYAANADAYLAELANTTQQIHNLIDTIPAERRYLITNHLAFNYFAERFGLTLVGVIIPGGSTTSQPSVQEILGLIDTVQQYSVPAIFTETTVSDDLARQISEETGATIQALYTGSLSQSGEPADTYLNYLHFNATQIANALK